MKYLIALLLLSACSPGNTPTNLKNRDRAEAKCREECKPREMQMAQDYFIGIKCLCVDEKKKD